MSFSVRIGGVFLVDTNPLFGGVKFGNFRNIKIGLFNALIVHTGCDIIGTSHKS